VVGREEPRASVRDGTQMARSSMGPACPAAGKPQAGDPASGQGRPEAVAQRCERERAHLVRGGVAEDSLPPGRETHWTIGRPHPSGVFAGCVSSSTSVRRPCHWQNVVTMVVRSGPGIVLLGPPRNGQVSLNVVSLGGPQWPRTQDEAGERRPPDSYERSYKIVPNTVMALQ
jgi:hypothetical protein